MGDSEGHPMRYKKVVNVKGYEKGETYVAKAEEGEIPVPLDDGVSGQDQEAGLKECQEKSGDLEGRKG